VELCGDNPCQGRINCVRIGRCIPINWCCHRPASITDGPYDCDVWQRQLCCSRPAVSNIMSDQASFLGGTMDDNNRLVTHGFNDPRRSAPSSSNGYDAVWGFQSAIFVVAGCTLAFVALILLASFLGARYLVRKLHRQQEQLDEEDTECQHHRRNQNFVSVSNGRRARSHSAPRRSSVENSSGRLIDSRRSSLENGEVLLRMYLLNNNGIRCSRHRHSRCHHCEPSCSLLVQYRPRQPPETASASCVEAPPPPYADLGKPEPPPAYASLAQIESTADDGLPGYTSALNLCEGTETENATH